MFNLRTQRLRGDALLLDEFVPGTTFEVGAQELVGHVPVPEEERRVGEEPLLELQAVVAVIENRIIGKDKPMGFDRELVGPERQRRRANHFKRGIPDDIGQLRREAGRLAWVFAEFQTAGRKSWSHYRCTKPYSRQWQTIAPEPCGEHMPRPRSRSRTGGGWGGAMQAAMVDRMTARIAAPAMLLLPSVRAE